PAARPSPPRLPPPVPPASGLDEEPPPHPTTNKEIAMAIGACRNIRACLRRISTENAIGHQRLRSRKPKTLATSVKCGHVRAAGDGVQRPHRHRVLVHACRVGA